ncbi:MAG: hypothetical protein WAU08_15175, partial [Flavobacteriales bacterium]
MALLALIAVLIYVPPVQHFLRGKAVGFLEKEIGTPVQVGHLALRFPVGIGLEGVLIHQQNGDTLLYAGSLKTRASLTALLNKQIALSSVDLADVRANITQNKDSVFNFDYILKALAGDSTAAPTPADTTAGWGFSIGSVSLKHVRVDLDLMPSRLQLALDIGSLDLGFDDFDASAMKFHIDKLALAHTRADLRMASGPPIPDAYPNLENPFEGLDVNFSAINLDDVQFTMKDVVKGDSLWLDLPKARVDADIVDLSQQLLALNEVEFDAPVFGMFSQSNGTLVDTVKVDPPWLDQHDGFRYFVRDMRVSAKEIAVKDGTFGMYSDSIATPRKLFDPDRLVLKSLNLGVEGLEFRNDSIAARVKRLNFINGPKDQSLALQTDVSATPDRLSIKDGNLAFGGNMLQFSAVAHPQNLTAAYRNPERVPLRVQARTSIQPEQLRPVLSQFGLERFMPAAFTEKLETRIALAGSVAQLDSAVLVVDGDQRSLIHLRGKGSNIEDWRTADLDVDLDRFELGNGFRQLLQTFTAPGTTLPQRLAATAHVRMRGGTAHAELMANSDMG